MEINYCCEGFKSRVNRSKEKGFSILKEKINNEMNYSLYFRITTKENEQKFKHEIQRTKFAVGHVFDGKVSIKFCPWCGTNLSE